MTSHSPTEPFADPGVAATEDGHVILEGPGKIAVTMTAQAAIATARSLLEAGERAQAQMIDKPSRSFRGSRT